TPMNGIIGMTDLALDTSITPQQRDYLTAVKSSAHALLALIDDILDFSRIEAGKMTLRCEEFVLRETLADALKPLAQRAEARGLLLGVACADTIPDLLAGDPWRLRQVLVHLVGNAVKFTQQGQVQVTVDL